LLLLLLLLLLRTTDRLNPSAQLHIINMSMITASGRQAW
jgi:hypothetical protein